MPAAPTPNSHSESTAARPSLVARLVALPLRAFAGVRHNLLLTVVLLCGLTIIGIAGYSYTVYYAKTHQPRSTKQILSEALRAVNARELDKAREALAEMPAMAKLTPGEQAQTLYLMGRIVAFDAERHGDSNDARVLYLVAVRYLDEARERGLPANLVHDGLWQLGRCQFAGGQYAESLPTLRAALKGKTAHAYEINRMAALANLRATPPNLKSAHHYSQAALEVPNLTIAQREEATLLNAQIFLQRHDFPASRQLFEQISAESDYYGEAQIGKAQSLLWEGTQALESDEENVDYEAARDKIREALAVLASLQPSMPAAVRYLTGVCYRALGDRDSALKSFEGMKKVHFSDATGFASNLNIAEMLQEKEMLQEMADPAPSLSAYMILVEQVTDTASYDNPWVPLTELRERLATALQNYLNNNEFAAALALCRSSEKVLVADVRTGFEAEAHRAWGERLLQEAETGPRHDAKKEADARKHFRQAGEAFSRLTTLRFTAPSYTDCLWKSGECYLLGQNYDAAIATLRQFLEHAAPPQRPQGLVSLGEALLSLSRHHEALQALEECTVTYPKHPEAYEARLLASQAYQELAQRRPAADAQDAAKQRAAALASAKKLLEDNLGIDDELAPNAEPFRKSKFAYGMLLFREGINLESSPTAAGLSDDERRKQELATLAAANALFQQALVELGEAVERYPDASEATLAQFQLAEAYLHAAKLPEASLAWEQTARGRTELKRERERNLTDAANTLVSLQQRLQDAQRSGALSKVEVAVLRNTYFMYPDTLYALGQYPQAIEAYTVAINRYKDVPESLDALVQIATCQRQLAALDDARTTLQQAKVMLNRIKADPNNPFEKTTRYSRTEWENLITWLAKL